LKKLRLLTAALSAAIAISSASSVFASPIYEMTEQSQLAEGITLKNIRQLTSSGWQNINVIEADLSGNRYTVKALTNKENLSKLTNVKALAEEHGTIAAINGDFFSWKKDETSLGSAIGGVVNDGDMLTSATSPWNFSTVAQKTDGSFIFDYIDCAIAVAAPNGFITPIEHINKYDDLTTPIIYTKEWGPLSPGSVGTNKEIVIENDTVISVNHDMGPVKFPENGYIISFLSDVSPELLENFNVGDKVEIGVNYEPKFEDIQFAVGAGTLLLKDGKETPITNDIAGNHPRTAIGVNDDHTKLYLVTVDGRQENSKGVTLSTLADIMADIGAYDAANLDGGGSTTLAVKSPYTGKQTVANSPSDSYLRAVANGIGIVATNKASGDGFLTIKTDSDCVFAGTEIYLDAKLHDSMGNILDYTPNEFEWVVSQGKVMEGFYTPVKPGKSTVSVSYGDVTAEKNLRVLEKPVKISTGLKQYNIKAGDSAYISLVGEDADGFKAYINLRDTDITSNSSIIDVDGNNIRGLRKGTAVVTFDFKGVQTSAVIRVGGDNKKVDVPEDKAIADSLTMKADETADSFKFAVFGNTSHKNTLTEKLIVLKYAELLNSDLYDLAVFAGDNILTPENIKADTVKTSEYSYTTYKNSSFITIDNTDVKQWAEFLKDIANTRSTNIFLFLPQSMSLENNMYANMLSDVAQRYFADKGKKLYVVGSGAWNIENDRGIKYISIEGVETIKTPATATEDAQYYEFTVSGTKVTCKAKKIYK